MRIGFISRGCRVTLRTSLDGKSVNRLINHEEHEGKNFISFHALRHCH